MSYNISVWLQPKNLPYPATLQACVDFLESESLVRCMQNPVFIQLCEILTDCYPDYLTALDSEEPDNWVWGEPLSGESTYSVLVININPDFSAKALSLLIREAKKLGLSIFDPQAGHAWFANDMTLPTGLEVPNRVIDNSAADIVPKNEILRIKVFELIEPLMIEYGFTPYKQITAFEMEFHGGELGIDLVSNSNSWPSHGEISFEVFGRINELVAFKEEMLPKWSPDLPIKNKPLTFAGYQKFIIQSDCNFLNVTKERYEVTNYDQISDVVSHMKQVFIDVLFPLLERAKSIQGLDSLINSTELSEDKNAPIKGAMPFFDNLYIAYLAKNKLLDRYITFFYMVMRSRRMQGLTILDRHHAVYELIEYIGANPLQA